jgi:uncharacterized membrane protein YkvA (DUF1232 family)
LIRFAAKCFYLRLKTSTAIAAENFSVLAAIRRHALLKGQLMFQRFKQLMRDFKRELHVYRLVLQDKRTPLLPKFLLGAAVGYLLLPFDLIPDFIPVIGQLDDLLIVPGLVALALRFIPQEIVEEARGNF